MLIDLISLRYEIFAELRKITSAFCLSLALMGRFLHTWRHSLPIIDDNLAATPKQAMSFLMIDAIIGNAPSLLPAVSFHL